MEQATRTSSQHSRLPPYPATPPSLSPSQTPTTISTSHERKIIIPDEALLLTRDYLEEPDELLPVSVVDEVIEPGPPYTKRDYMRGQKIKAQEIVHGKRSKKGLRAWKKFVLFTLLALALLAGTTFGVMTFEGVVMKKNESKQQVLNEYE
jgi:hypothetical protein